MVGVVRKIVVMGVSGCGKTLIGKALADRLGFAFVEGDDHHSDRNKEKMGHGIPLDDDDRQGWLLRLRDLIGESGGPMVLSCSALKRSYRSLLTSGEHDLIFVHLHGSMELIEKRIRSREGHFFDPDLLASQFDTLEILEPQENGFEVKVDQTEQFILAEICSRLDDCE